MKEESDSLAEAKSAGLSKATTSTHPPADSSKHPSFAPDAIKNAYATRPEEDEAKPDEAPERERR